MSHGGRQDLFGLLEGYYLTAILDLLYRSGALAALRSGQSLDALARELGYDGAILAALVAYVEQRTVGVVPVAASADNATATVDVAFLGHLLDQYVGAFGPCLGALEQVLADPGAGPRHVDWTRHMRAFAGADRGAANRLPLQLLAELDINCIIDLGCGTGGLLLDFATANPAAKAWGIDSNRVAIQAAADAARQAGLDGRVSFLVGDASACVPRLNHREVEAVQALTAFNLANAFFDPGGERSIRSWLGMLAQAFPNRLLLLGDYYARLASGTPSNSHAYRRTLMHDVAQVLTRQGLPPADIAAWRTIFDDAGCTLVKAFEGEHEEVAHFLYLVQL
jgi:SAM-dependent methyltransferase